MIEIIIYTLCFVLYSCLEGFREGLYFHYKTGGNLIPVKLNEHIEFAVQRGIVLFIIGYSSNWIYAIGLALIFPFFHDGIYYLTRNKLNNTIYLKGFLDNPSNISTAVMDFNLITRSLMFIIGLVIIVIKYMDT